MRTLPLLALSFFLAASAPAADTSTFVTVDLSKKINTSLDASVLFKGESHTNHLQELPAGKNVFEGIPFAVSGTIQLDCLELHVMGKDYPKRVSNIEIGQSGSKIHLLHGTAWQDIPGVPLADLEIRYEGGGSETLTIIYGVHVRDWWELKKDEIKDPNSKIVWRGNNPQAKAANATLRLYRTTFDNPRPGKKIASIDYIARGSKSGPFMVGLTIENP